MNFRVLYVAALLAAIPVSAPAAEENTARAAPGGPTIDLSELIARVARKSGKQFVIDPHANGTVPTAGFEVERVDYPMLLAILRVNGLATFTQGGIVSVVPDAIARQLSTPTLTADDPKIPDDELVTRVVQTRNICAAHAVPVLRPMMPQFAHLAAFPATNTLLIVDRAANARRIADLIERLDKQAGAKQDCGSMKSGS